MAIDREKVLAAAQKHVEKKKYDKAVLEYQKVIQEDPNDARTLLKIGDLQSKMEAYADAVATYERVGKYYASQGFALKAIAVYKQIREIIAKHLPQLEEKYAFIAPKLAELYQQLGLTSDALSALDEVATRLQRQNRDGEAIEVFRKIVKLDPTNPLPHLRLAEALSRAKDADGAVAEFGIAAQQLAKLGRRDDALKVIERLLHHKPDPAQARLAAEIYLARGGANDGMQALAKLQLSFQANPRDLDTLGLLARAFTQIGQAAKAIEVQKEMARIARDSGKLELFEDLIAKLKKLAPNDEVVRQLAMGSTMPGPASLPAPARAMPPPAPQQPARPQTLSEEDYEDVGDSDIEEEPLELSRRAHRPVDDDEVVVETSIVEGVAAADSPQSRQQIARILAEAESFRRARAPDRATEMLRIGLEIAPRSMELHEALRNVLVEFGPVQEAVEVMLAIAGLQIDNLDGDAAARTLQDLLSFDPGNDRAADMLRELGYELVEEAPTGMNGHTLPPREQYPTYDPEAPLPSYDLEEVGPADVARAYSEPSVRVSEPPAAPAAPAAQARAERPARALEEIDDPFGDAPLPSFPLEPPAESAAPFDLVAGDGDASDRYAATTVAPAPKLATSTPGPELESALEEAEFFASRGLYDDARTILEEQLTRLPNHPLLLERITELDAQERGVQGGSGTRPSPSASAGGAPESVDDRSFDIAESLGALEELDRPSGVGPGPSFGAPAEQVDVEEVFAKFKEGVAQQIGDDDAQSHYDLGVAYKEMQLIDDAIREFETAANDPRQACICHSMIGMIHLERGNLNEAIDSFIRGLQAPERSKEQEAALSYEIGAAYEVKRMSKQALDYFQRAARLIPTFRDVQERIRRLQKVEPKQPVRAVAVGADDEFERAFGDILGERKLP